MSLQSPVDSAAIRQSLLMWRWAGMALLVTIVGAIGAVITFAWDVAPHGLDFRFWRTLHVTFALGWIFLGAFGGMAVVLPLITGRPLQARGLFRVAGWLAPLTGLAVIASYLTRTWSGREYLAYWPPISGLVMLGVILMFVGWYRNVRAGDRNWTPTHWMWASGFFLFFWTFIENHLWLIPGFVQTITHDMTIQWKSLGSFAGAWNMLLYGLLAAVHPHTGQPTEAGRRADRMAMALFFVSLTNSLFNWGHHTYHLPQSMVIHIVAFVISMTEVLLLIKYVQSYKKALKQPELRKGPVEVLMAHFVTFWIVVMLITSIVISIPLINTITHGTHVTVAHAMMATIGINSNIIFTASVAALRRRARSSTPEWLTGRSGTFGKLAVWITNIGLLAMFVALNGAGLVRGLQQHEGGNVWYSIVADVQPWIEAFAYTGFLLAMGLLLLLGWWMTALFRFRAGADTTTAEVVSDPSAES